ncbi:MAG: right-handed parallel beta-helix repeat-containing protein, partial [Candidatus Altiarchaeota archaeon]|nr:right-handed parallel beta-helix repeat-containing protein [Candidatus Altiarchaeota archaeon]
MAKDVLLGLFVILLLPTVLATDYYVDKSGISGTCADANPGTIMQPWCTINKAVQTVRAGDTVYIRQGVYYESLTMQNSGAPGNPITFKAYPGDECKGEYAGLKSDCGVVIDGSYVLSGTWQRDGGDIYYIDVPDGVLTQAGKDSVFVEGDRFRYATEPDQATPYFNYGNYNIAQSMTESSVYDPVNLNQANGFWTGGYVKFRFTDSSHRIREITGFTSNTLSFDPLDIDIGNLHDGKYTYIMINHLSLLDQPGEFYIDYKSSPKRLYLITLDRQSPQGQVVSINHRSKGIYMNYKSYIRIEGLEIRKHRGGAIDIQDYYHSDIDGIDVVNNYIHDNGNPEGIFYEGGDGVAAQNVRGLLVENNEFFRNSISAIVFGG